MWLSKLFSGTEISFIGLIFARTRTSCTDAKQRPLGAFQFPVDLFLLRSFSIAPESQREVLNTLGVTRGLSKCWNLIAAKSICLKAARVDGLRSWPSQLQSGPFLILCVRVCFSKLFKRTWEWARATVSLASWLIMELRGGWGGGGGVAMETAGWRGSSRPKMRWECVGWKRHAHSSCMNSSFQGGYETLTNRRGHAAAADNGFPLCSLLFGIAGRGNERLSDVSLQRPHVF